MYCPWCSSGTSRSSHSSSVPPSRSRRSTSGRQMRARPSVRGGAIGSQCYCSWQFPSSNCHASFHVLRCCDTRKVLVLSCPSSLLPPLRRLQPSELTSRSTRELQSSVTQFVSVRAAIRGREISREAWIWSLSTMDIAVSLCSDAL